MESSLTMLSLIKLELAIFDIVGRKYLTWILDTKIHFDAMNLETMIKEGNQTSLQDSTKTLIFPHHHLLEGFKNEYLTINYHFTLQSDLKESYDHKKTMILPKA